jgi:ABC-type uncharacterized transport system YnjBCD permease subunit
MSQDANLGDELVSKLKLDVKALTLLYESDAALKDVVDRAFTLSGDASMLRFAGMLQPRRKPGGAGSILISVGEIILASFLTVLGLAAFVPAMIGLLTPHQFIEYFSNVLAPSLNSGPLYVGAPALDFVFASVLVLCAFYTLRQASRSIKESGLARETSVR